MLVRERSAVVRGLWAWGCTVTHGQAPPRTVCCDFPATFAASSHGKLGCAAAACRQAPPLIAKCPQGYIPLLAHEKKPACFRYCGMQASATPPSLCWTLRTGSWRRWEACQRMPPAASPCGRRKVRKLCFFFVRSKYTKSKSICFEYMGLPQREMHFGGGGCGTPSQAWCDAPCALVWGPMGGGPSRLAEWACAQAGLRCCAAHGLSSTVPRASLRGTTHFSLLTCPGFPLLSRPGVSRLTRPCSQFSPALASLF
jgi:hypothetical protein